MPIKSFRLPALDKTKLQSLIAEQRVVQWRWVSILLLGIVSNTLVNLFFDLKYNRPLLSINLEEYYNAILVALLILEGNRSITKILNARVPWSKSRGKRVVWQLGLHLAYAILILNALVVGITYFFYNSFYAFSDLLIINAAVVPFGVLFSSIGMVKSANTRPSIWRVFRWSWVSIVLLGIGSNTLVNAIFDYKYQRSLVSLSVEEYFNAIIASWLLLAGTRWIARKLNTKIPWTSGVLRRLLSQLGLQFVFIVVALNVPLITITYLIYGGFYAFDELMIINISAVSLTFFFAVIDTGIFFYKNWDLATKNPKSVILDYQKPIQVSLGKSHYMINQEDIRCAISNSGLVVVMTNDQRKLPYSESLENLMKKLDPVRFFRANRQTVLSHQAVESMKALDYGKIEVTLAPLNGQPTSITISRTRAAEFRRWLKSQAA